ncbi:MAG: hypothetical protein L7U83_12495 [Akkermansiaceae bacterium]|nr:hypothetical protein [Akkermansiaceae bacterium]
MKVIFLGFTPTFHSLKALKQITLFDGKSLDQREGNPKFWRIEDKTITASALSLSMGKPRNYFQATGSSHNGQIKMRKTPFKQDKINPITKAIGGHLNSDRRCMIGLTFLHLALTE